MTLPNLPADKANHAIYGAAIFSAVLLIASLLRAPHEFITAAVVVAIVAVAKEFNDAWINYRATGSPMHGPHGVEALDAVATCFGGVLAALPVLILRGV